MSMKEHPSGIWVKNIKSIPASSRCTYICKSYSIPTQVDPSIHIIEIHSNANANAQYRSDSINNKHKPTRRIKYPLTSLIGMPVLHWLSSPTWLWHDQLSLRQSMPSQAIDNLLRLHLLSFRWWLFCHTSPFGNDWGWTTTVTSVESLQERPRFFLVPDDNVVGVSRFGDMWEVSSWDDSLGL